MRQEKIAAFTLLKSVQKPEHGYQEKQQMDDTNLFPAFFFVELHNSFLRFSLLLSPMAAKRLLFLLVQVASADRETEAKFLPDPERHWHQRQVSWIILDNSR